MTEVNNLSPNADVSEINDENTSFISEQLIESNRLMLITDLTAIFGLHCNPECFYNTAFKLNFTTVKLILQSALTQSRFGRQLKKVNQPNVFNGSLLQETHVIV